MISMQYSFNYQEYQQRIKKKSNHSFTILIITIILLFGLAVFLFPHDLGISYLYFVEVNNFINYSEANKLANEIKEKNGAGYIYYDGKYHVLASFYPSKSDAETIAENLKAEYPSSSVYSLEIKRYNKKNSLTSEQNKVILNTIEANESLIDSLYKCNISFDTGEFNESELSIKLKVLKNEIEKSYKAFNSEFKTLPKFDALSIELDIFDSMNTILGSFNGGNVSQCLKYELIKIVINHSCFLSAF